VSLKNGKKVTKMVSFWGNFATVADFLHQNLAHEVSDSNKTVGYHYPKIHCFL
jgi:hypothetical protein